MGPSTCLTVQTLVDEASNHNSPPSAWTPRPPPSFPLLGGTLLTSEGGTPDTTSKWLMLSWRVSPPDVVWLSYCLFSPGCVDASSPL